MKVFVKIFVILLIAQLCFGAETRSSSGPGENPEEQLVMQNISPMPLAFAENHGQWDERALFRADAGGVKVWITAEGVYYQFLRHVPADNSDQENPDNFMPNRFRQEPESVEQLVIRASIVSANPNPKAIGEECMDYRCNYFLGNDPNRWRTDVPNYKVVILKNIYAGIDLKYYGNGDGKLEYDFIIAPNADPAQIAIRYNGAEEIWIDDGGQLVVETKWGTMTGQRPLVYQIVNGERIDLKAQYCLKADNSFCFKLSGNYNPQFAAVIDPVLGYSTYLCGSNDDRGQCIAVDESGSAYAVGSTISTDFPLVEPYQTDQPSWDVFVTKLNIAGNGLVYSTYLGGDQKESGYGIAVDSSGCVYVTGETYSTDFPLAAPYQIDQPGEDGFVTKLNLFGNGLVWSSYFGGNSGDYGDGLCIYQNRYVYIIGATRSTDFPTKNPFQLDQPGDDAFIMKLDADSCNLIYSTYLGGSNNDSGDDIGTDEEGNVYITGITQSIDFPLVNPCDSCQTAPSIDGFAAKLNITGSQLLYSTCLGGDSSDYPVSLAVDAMGNAYIVGETKSVDYPTINPFQTDQPGEDAFVTKLNPNGECIFSTYLGGSGFDVGTGVAVDIAGRAHISGYTDSPDFPLANPLQADPTGFDVFITGFKLDGNGLHYSTYLGGNDADYAFGIAVGRRTELYLVGITHSTDFPTRNPYQMYDNCLDPSNAFVTKLLWFLCGDANGDGIANVSDAVYIINYVFIGGPAPNPIESGDANCDRVANVSDAVWIINYVFAGGLAPCANCP